MPGAHSLRGGGRIADSDAPVPVLIHGFLGFSRLGGLEYFRGVQRQLAGLGVTPVIPQLPPLDSVRERAEALAAILAQHKAREFVLFGHSTGGLDARYLCAHLDPARRVKAVVTVGTPHLGSAEAAMMLSRW